MKTKVILDMKLEIINVLYVGGDSLILFITMHVY